MALQSETNFNGILVGNAYIRVVGVSFQRPRWDVLISVEKFASQEAERPFDSCFFLVPYVTEVGGNVVAWAYAQMKALPEFTDAIDV